MKKRTALKAASVIMVVLLLAQLTVVAQAAPSGKGKPPKNVPPPVKWTLMVYIGGDNSLDEYVALDIETELAPTGSNEDVSVVALADRAATGDWTQTLLFYVTQDTTATPESAVADWGEANMGDPQTLIDFVNWTKANHPAEHYALSFWNHGWSWRPGSTMADETNDDHLDQHEIASALARVGPIDVIMYDACQMGTIENQATVRAYSQAFVASQEWVNWDGIEYELVIPGLQADPDMTPEEAAILINYSASVNSERTGSAVALNAAWDALIVAVDEWALALDAGLGTYRSGYWSAFHGAQSFVGDGTAIDLYDLAYNIRIRVADTGIQAKCQVVMDAVDAVVLDEWHTTPYHGAHGISIWGPVRPQDLDNPNTTDLNEFDYYQNELFFGGLTHWDEFLYAFVNGS